MKKYIGFLLAGVLSQGSGARMARWCITGLVATVWAAAATAEPIEYTLFVQCCGVGGERMSGMIGTNTFTKGVAMLQFVGDTSTVLPFMASNAPDPGWTNGYIMLNGAATILIYDLANGASYSAGFLPAAGVYVSIDNTHASVGFGSLPGSTGFPGYPVYPEGMLGFGPDYSTYDLKSSHAASNGWSISNYAFPGVPTNPLASTPTLPTTAGNFGLNGQGPVPSTFQAQLLSALAPFPYLLATTYASDRRFALVGKLTLARCRNCFHYATDALTLQFGPYSVTLPGGSLVQGEEGSLRYSGIVSGAQLSVVLYPDRAGNGYLFHIGASGVNLVDLGMLTTLKLGLGDNSGSISVPVHSYGDDDCEGRAPSADQPPPIATSRPTDAKPSSRSDNSGPPGT